MAQISGSDIQVLLYHESAWGVDPGTPAAQIAYIQSLGLTANQNLVTSEVISGGRGVRRPGAGNLSVAGAIRTEVAPENIGFWLSHLLGAPTTTGVSAPYTHGFVPDALPAGFRVEKDYTAALASKVERFRGCRISSATFTLPQEGFVTAEFQIAGKDHAIITAPLDAAPADPGHAGFTGFEGTVKQGGSPLGYVMSGSLTIDNSLRTDMFVIGGGELYALALPLAEELVLTEVDADFAGDTVFPRLDPALWQAVQREPGPPGAGPAFAFVRYRRSAD
jgi:hypothetical protein